MPTAEGEPRPNPDRSRLETVEELLLNPENIGLLSLKYHTEFLNEQQKNQDVEPNPCKLLANLYIQSGIKTITALSKKNLDAIIDINNYEKFQFSDKDKESLFLGYGAIFFGAATIALQNSIDSQIPDIEILNQKGVKARFDNKYFCDLYNSKLTGTIIPKIKQTDIFQAGEPTEKIYGVNFKTISTSYEENGAIDFRKQEVWEALPDGLRECLKNKKIDKIIQETLSPTFIEQLTTVPNTQIFTEIAEKKEPTQTERNLFSNLLGDIPGLDQF